MTQINLWESKQAKNYQYFTSAEEYFQYLKDNNKYLSFILRNSYNPENPPEKFLENNVSKQDVEFTMTNQSHPIAANISPFFDTYIEPSFFEANRPLFEKYAKEQLLNDLKNNEPFINIPDFIYHDNLFYELASELNKTPEEFLKFLRSKSLRYETTTNKPLPEETIKKITDNYLEFTIDDKQISTKRLISFYTYDEIQEMDKFNLKIPLDEKSFQYFKYAKEPTTIKITQDYSNIFDESNYFNQVKYFINQLSEDNHQYIIQIEVDNRTILKESSLLASLPSNISVLIDSDLTIYNQELYEKEEKYLESLVKPIIEDNLSPLERYLAVYNIVKQYKKYRENPKDTKQSRYLRYIVDNEYLVCVGFAKLLKNLLDKVHIEVKQITVSVDTSYDSGFTQEEKLITNDGHVRNIIKLDDDKYNVHGIYLTDATWDNNLNKDLYSNVLLTFDRKKEAKRLERLNNLDLLFDFHNFKEYKTKIAYYFKKEISKKKDYYLEQGIDEMEAYSDENFINICESLYNQILDILQYLDYPKYCEFYQKYNEKYINMYSTSKKDSIDNLNNIFLTDFYNYLEPLTNQAISMDTILKAATIAKASLGTFKDKEEQDTWYETTSIINNKRNKLAFPYIYNPNNPTEAYLESVEETTVKTK